MNSRALWALLGTQALLTAGLALSYPFFALYLHRDRGLGTGWVGFWLCVMMLCGAVGTALAGDQSDARGPKAVMSFALFGRALLIGGMAAAVWCRAPISMIIALHIAGGFVGYFFDPAIRSWIASSVEPAQRVALYGRQRVAVNLGWAVGPALGGLLAAKSYALTFGVTSIVCLACGTLALRGLPDEPARTSEGASLSGALSAARDPRFLEYCAWCVVLAAVMAQLVAPLSLHAVDYVSLSERQVGALFALNGVIVILGVLPASDVAAKLTSALGVGCLLYAAGYVAVGFSRGFWALAASVAVVTLGEIVVSPRLPALAANLAPKGRVGRYMGFQGLCFQTGSALGPLLGGAGLEHLSPRWTPAPWLVVGALGAAAAAGFSRLGRFLTHSEEGRFA